MEEKYNAIVIKSTNYKDNDKMITLFTLEKGIVSACLRGAKKAGAKLGFAGEIFCFGEFVLIEKDGRRTVKEVNQIDSFYNVRLDTDKFYAASACVEYVLAFMFDGMESYDLFLSVISALKTLSETDFEPTIVLTGFYLKALELSGYELDFSKCTLCGKKIDGRVFFDFESGGAVCAQCAEPLFTEIRFSTYSLLKTCAGFADGGFANEKYYEILAVSDELSRKSAVKFLDYVIKQKTGVTIKSNEIFI